MKSILLHIYDDTGFSSRLQAALDLARAFGGHITCLHATPFEDYLAADPLLAAVFPVELSKKMERRRLNFQARTEERLKDEGVTWDWVHLNEQVSTSLIRYSVVTDIIVLSLTGPALMRSDPRQLAGAVSTGARAPVLAVPQSLEKFDPAAPALVAWNGSPEAAAAMRSALPILRHAAGVYLLQVRDAVSHYPSDLAARYLSRHGVEAEIMGQRSTGGSVSEIIRSSALQLQAGTIVMGAYGHSRLKEFLLGGVTRDLLADSEIPLIMAH